MKVSEALEKLTDALRLRHCYATHAHEGGRRCAICRRRWGTRRWRRRCALWRRRQRGCAVRWMG